MLNGFFIPAAAVALDKSDRGGWPPRAREVGTRRFIHQAPGLADRIDPAPGSFNISQSFMPSSGCSLIASVVGEIFPDSFEKIKWGTSRKTTMTSETLCGKRLPVRR